VRNAKTQFLQIRLTPADRKRIDRLAAGEHLDTSTWARKTLLRAVDEAEAAKAETRSEG
jgi:hypothetical protein